jgi:putative chitinase
MQITPATLAAVTGQPVNDNMQSTLRGLLLRPVNLAPPHRLYQFLGQAALESGSWRYDRELWGKKPTAAQDRYDIRKDLGNTPERDGDGYLYRGRSGFQITGKANYRQFTTWAQANYASAPNFVAAPDLINADPWEGLAAIWFWESRGLSALADLGDMAAITKRINGGYTALDDRVAWSVAFGILLAGHKTVRDFQSAHMLTVDGIAGPITRGILHKVLLHCPPVLFALS